MVKKEEIYAAPLRGKGAPAGWLLTIARPIVRVLAWPFFRCSYVGMDNIPDNQNVVMVGNHTSYLDPVFLVAHKNKRELRLIAKSELLENKFFGWLLPRLGALPIKRGTADRTAIKYSVATLKRGEDLVIFPEGTRVRKPNQEVKLHSGAALIAKMANCPILPFAIVGASKIKPYGSIFARFPKVTVKYGKPITLDDPRFEGLAKNELFDEVTRVAMEDVYKLRDGE
jgi:1-acyl-sn-glycerol-3-phosphate acyltransferase